MSNSIIENGINIPQKEAILQSLQEISMHNIFGEKVRPQAISYESSMQAEIRHILEVDHSRREFDKANIKMEATRKSGREADWLQAFGDRNLAEATKHHLEQLEPRRKGDITIFNRNIKLPSLEIRK